MKSLLRRRFLYSAVFAVIATALAVPLAGGDFRQGAMAAAIAALPAIALSWWFAAGPEKRLHGITAFVNASRPDGPPLPVGDPADEFGGLATSLNKMAQRVDHVLNQRSEQSSREAAVLANMQEGVLAVDRRLAVVYCNEAFAQALDLNRTALAGIPLRQVIRNVHLVGAVEQVQRTGEPVASRLTIRTNSEKAFELRGFPIQPPETGGVLLILHEITALERLERIRQDFVANVSHELRTPLTAILGYSDTLLDGALEDQAHSREFVQIIRSHAIRLANIAEDLLRLSRLDALDGSGDLEAVSVRGAIESTARLVEIDARDHSVTLHIGQLPNIEVLADPASLDQALLNLLSNAIKFNRPGGEVHVTAQLLPEDRVQIAVHDTGIGIASEHQSRLFERFYRVDKARSRAAGGTGLGLAIVKHAVEKMGGSVAVESQLGKGSTFAIVLPAKDSRTV